MGSERDTEKNRKITSTTTKANQRRLQAPNNKFSYK